MRVCRFVNFGVPRRLPATSGPPVAAAAAAAAAAVVWPRPRVCVPSDEGRHAGGSGLRRRLCTLAVAPAASAPPPPRLVLGIETSCDDTGAAVVTTDGRVLGEAIAHQAEIHAAWGGVVPNLAMEAHREAIDRVVAQALSRAGVGPEQLHAVAVTIGPGLSLCLKVGISKARQVARQHQLPLIHVHHMEGHALVARLPPHAAAAAPPALDCTAGLGGGVAHAGATARPSPQQPQAVSGLQVGAGDVGAGEGAFGSPAVPFPFLCLLVSGGHNLLLLVQGVGQYMQLGTTLDDALGEAYDKVARMLGLELKPNGGAALEALAKQGDPQAFKFVIPMRQHATCDFSYAGLKTSVRLAIEQACRQHQQQQQQAGESEEADGAGAKLDPHALPLQVKADVAASFQRVACVHLTDRVKRGITWAKEVVPGLSDLVVAGGVASNQYIRAELSELSASQGLRLVMPPPRWCTDNGVMIAWAGIERLRLGLVEPPPPPHPAPQLPNDDAATATATSPGQPPETLQEAESSGRDHATAPHSHADAIAIAHPAVSAGVPELQGSGRPEQSDEWIDIKPRWPLTTDYHPRREPSPWNARKARIHTSLTELTAAATAGTAAATGTAVPTL